MSRSAEHAYLAFDLGASSGRAVLGRARRDGGIELEQVHRFPNAPVTTDAGVFWDIEALFAHMLEAMRMVSARGLTPRAIGVDTWGVDFALLDADRRLLERPRSYREPRNAGLSARLVQRIRPERLLERTGSMHQDHASLCQLLAVKEHTPDLLARARRLLFIPDLLRLWLCGDERTDCAFASTSQMYDAVRCEWATEILAELDLPAEILPPVQVGPAVVGTLSREIRRRTGLGAAAVVAGAGHDTSAAFGTCLPVFASRLDPAAHLPDPNELVVISSGTWSILGIFVDAHLPPGTLDPTRFGYEANPDGSLRIVRNLTGGWLIEQCRKAWAAAGVECSYESLIASARAAAGSERASAVLDPQWAGFMHPPDMPAAIVEYCRRTDQPAPRTPGEFAQVIFASLAAGYAEAIDELRAKTARPLSKLYMIGGMARNEYLNELTAQRAGVEVIVGPAEATAMGNVAVQMAAVEA